MELVHARVAQNDCPECLIALVMEARSLGLPIQGEVGIIPKHWLNANCPHGRTGLRFDLVVADAGVFSRESGRTKSDGVELEAVDTRIDATKDMGYPTREHGPYGSHPMHDDFDDESDPDGSGTY
jgi:hypothetical protein